MDSKKNLTSTIRKQFFIAKTKTKTDRAIKTHKKKYVQQNIYNYGKHVNKVT